MEKLFDALLMSQHSEDVKNKFITVYLKGLNKSEDLEKLCEYAYGLIIKVLYYVSVAEICRVLTLSILSVYSSRLFCFRWAYSISNSTFAEINIYALF